MKNKYYLAFTIFTILMTANIVQAESYCLDNSTIRTSFNTTVNGVLTSTSIDSICQYGCSDNACNPKSFTIDLYVAGALIGLIVLLLFINWMVRRA